jgi:hypothetical protein
MQTKWNLLMAVAGIIMVCACAIKQTNDIKKAEWLIGTWENKTESGNIYESWTKMNEHEFSGRSYMLNEKDTVVFENIRLVQEQDELFYVPTVKNQNEGLPVRFASTTISATEIIFENSQHDFPQIISYSKMNADSLVAEISGIKNGQKQKQIFPMKRVK